MLREMYKIPLISALLIFIVAGLTTAVMAQNENGTFTVYYNNPDNWDQVYAYAWEEGNGEYVSWPGEPMTEPVEGSQWYSYEIPDNFNRVIFNNGDEGEQTDDLERNEDGWFDGEEWSDEPPLFTVYYNNPENWDEVYAYTWDHGNGEYVSWPGEAMTEPEEDSDWYSYDIPANFNRVIFNNAGEGEQTDDLIRNTDGWFDGTQWYDANPDDSFFIQIIHASADPAAAEVDIYVNADPVEDDPFLAGVAFQDATGFVDLDPDEDYNIAITGAGSEEIVYSIDVSSDLLQAGDVFVAVARGDLDAEEGDVTDEHTEFGIDLLEGRLTSEDVDNVDIQIYHAVTDAPAVDVWVRDTDEPFVADLEFGSGSDGYISVPADLYYLDIYAAGDSPDDVDPLQSFRLEAEDAGGQATVGLATGYLAGINGNDLPPFEVMFAFADGSTVFPANVTSSEDEFDEIPRSISLSQNYPNPFNPVTNIQYQIPSDMHVELTVYNSLGQKIATLVDDQVRAGTHEVSFDGSRLASGVYIYRLQAEGQVITNQMTLVK